MSEWIRMTIDSWIAPLYDLQKKIMLSQTYLQADETPIKVLDRKKKGKTHIGYYWVYHSPPPDMVLFAYKIGRGREGPFEMLKYFKGRLQTDGYSVYEGLQNPDIILFCCMAHARRYFDQALGNDMERAEFMLLQIQQLYATEHKAKELNLPHISVMNYGRKNACLFCRS